jgi:hypothetical protein
MSALGKQVFAPVNDYLLVDERKLPWSSSIHFMLLLTHRVRRHAHEH